MMEKEEYIDMHLHTNCSDGALSPNELVNLAVATGLTTISITDHDTVDAYLKIDLGCQNKIKIIKGIEMNAHVDVGQMHILGYGIDLENKMLRDMLVKMKEIDRLRIMKLVSILNRNYKISFNEKDIIELTSNEKRIGRPDLAHILLKMRLVNSIQEAFQKFLIYPYDEVRREIKGIGYEEVINSILNAGGIPVLAHPKTLLLNDDDFNCLLKRLINYGLMGLEVFHSDNVYGETEKYLKLCEQYDLLYSGGSDFHGGKVKSDVSIGSGKGNLKIKKLSILEYLKKN